MAPTLVALLSLILLRNGLQGEPCCERTDFSRWPSCSSGQVPSSEDEAAPKKQKLSAYAKKEESKPKYDASASEPVLSSADEVILETLPENASEPDLESASHAHLERKFFPVPPGDGHPEPSPLEGPSCPASCGGGLLTTVTVSGRDPRTASSGSCTVVAPAAARLDDSQQAEPRQDVVKPAATSVTTPKSILAKPSLSPEPRYLLSVPPSPSIRCGPHLQSEQTTHVLCH